jgi:hypothetical protein
MNETVTNLAGWIPAVILPTATLFQLIKIIRSKSAAGVSLMTWFLFGLANIGLYVFTEKYQAPQTLIGLLGTAALNFMIVGKILSLHKKARTFS